MQKTGQQRVRAALQSLHGIGKYLENHFSVRVIYSVAVGDVIGVSPSMRLSQQQAFRMLQVRDTIWHPNTMHCAR